jgi:A/G-specific adenine glycosylase
MKTFAEKLNNWYKADHRDLPFRHTKDPYQIWVSEVMAQQTRIESMLPYYEKWMM